MLTIPLLAASTPIQDTFRRRRIACRLSHHQVPTSLIINNPRRRRHMSVIAAPETRKSLTCFRKIPARVHPQYLSHGKRPPPQRTDISAREERECRIRRKTSAAAPTTAAGRPSQDVRRFAAAALFACRRITMTRRDAIWSGLETWEERSG